MLQDVIVFRPSKNEKSVTCAVMSSKLRPSNGLATVKVPVIHHKWSVGRARYRSIYNHSRFIEVTLVGIDGRCLRWADLQMGRRSSSQPQLQ
jgi:hypothetical protein